MIAAPVVDDRSNDGARNQDPRVALNPVTLLRLIARRMRQRLLMVNQSTPRDRNVCACCEKRQCSDLFAARSVGEPYAAS
jgi:hypothetical protein